MENVFHALICVFPFKACEFHIVVKSIYKSNIIAQTQCFFMMVSFFGRGGGGGVWLSNALIQRKEKQKKKKDKQGGFTTISIGA